MMVDKKTWAEFRKTGMLWLVNSMLHLFGWAIVFDVDDSGVRNVYPARVKFRGFSEKINAEGYAMVSEYLFQNSEALLEETREGADQ